MNWDIVKGNATIAKGKMKEMFGDLTDDEVTEMEGGAEAMAGKLQAKYGMEKAKAEAKVNEFLESLKM